MAFPDDEHRLHELLHHKIGFNAVARVTVVKDENPRLRTVRYHMRHRVAFLTIPIHSYHLQGN